MYHRQNLGVTELHILGHLRLCKKGFEVDKGKTFRYITLELKHCLVWFIWTVVLHLKMCMKN